MRLKLFFIILSVSILSACSGPQKPDYEYPESKLWAHGVYTGQDARRLQDVFDGLEVDIIYSAAKNNLYVGRVEYDTVKNHTFDYWLSHLYEPEKICYWVDFKNLSVDNAESASILLDELSSKYNIRDKMMVESTDTKALKKVKDNGFYVILWVDNLYWQREDDTTSICKKIRDKIDFVKPDAISCEYRMFPLLCDSFPEQNIHFWDTPKKPTPENIQFTQKLCRNESVRVVLTDYPEPIEY